MPGLSLSAGALIEGTTCKRRQASSQAPSTQRVVHDLDVTLVDSEAEVTDKAVIDASRGLSAEPGVRTSGGRPPKREAPPPDVVTMINGIAAEHVVQRLVPRRNQDLGP